MRNRLINLAGFCCDHCYNDAIVVWTDHGISEAQCLEHEAKPRLTPTTAVMWDSGHVNRKAVTRMADKYDVPVTAMHETTMGQSAW